MRSNVKRLAVFCTLLMLWSAIAVVAHHHSTKSESVRCTVCVGAHSAAPRAISNRPSPSFVRVSVVHLASSSFSHRIISFALSVRPPPQFRCQKNHLFQNSDSFWFPNSLWEEFMLAS